MNPGPDFRRVLLLDDDHDDLELTQDVFARIRGEVGYRVDSLDNVHDALEALNSTSYDVALVDYQLRGHTALDVLAIARESHPQLPVIVLTGRANPEVDQRCLELGAADFLVKDRLDPVVLERSIRYAIERQQLNSELRQREREYHSLFAGSPIAMLTYDPDELTILQVNQAACEQYGYSEAEFEGLSMLALRKPEHVAAFIEFTRMHRDDPGPLRAGIWRHQRKDGSELDVEILRSDVERAGRMVRVVAVQDVSARVRAERDLRASESTLRQVLTDMADGLIVFDADQRILLANPVACATLATPVEELIGAPVPDALLQDRSSIEFIDGKDQVHSLDLRLSQTQWNGAQARLLMIRDMTAERARDRQMVLLQRAANAIGEGILVSDMRLKGEPITYVNPAAERITGYAANELLGRNCRMLQGQDRDQPGIRDMRAALAGRRSCTVEVRNYRRNGDPFWNRVTLSPVRDADGEVSHYVGVLADVSVQKQLEAERRYLETHDALTDLPTYSAASGQIDRLVMRSQDRGLSAAVMFVDLDGFNLVNDTMGFAIGDAALREVALRLRRLCEASAAGETEIMRYAGDEFLLVLGMLPAGVDVLKLATHFCDVIARPMPLSANVTLFLTASIGASVTQQSSIQGAELVRQADIATHHAKRGGRNGAVVFGHSMSEALGDRLRLGGSMRSALARGEFVLHYQPQVNAHDGALIGLEALVRWNSPEFGMLAPKRFIPVAESNGMILALGAWVLQDACAQIRRWQDQGLTGFSVSVNVSAAQMQRPTFVHDVQTIIENAGVDPTSLELELTESVLMDNADRAIEQMQQLKKLGLRLVLDDFGMGYSSLDYLRRFPLDKLKIDQAFVNGIIEQDRDAALVRAIIAIGHNLGMRVVAEGVETAAQSAYLRRNYCDELQGFYIGHAVPVEQIPDLARRKYLLPTESGPSMTERCLLILDDEENIRRSLSRLLRRDGYRVLSAATASEAFELLAMHPVQVVLSDQRMPDLSGTEFLSRVKDMYPDTIRMVLSGYTDLSTVTEAINKGAIYKFLTKPWDDEELRAQVQEAFRRHSHDTFS